MAKYKAPVTTAIVRLALAMSVTVVPSIAMASTIINRDNVVREIRVLFSPASIARRQVRLLPGGEIRSLCTAGCTIRIDGSAEKDFILDGSERTSIEGGLLYYDGDAKAAAKVELPMPEPRGGGAPAQ